MEDFIFKKKDETDNNDSCVALRAATKKKAEEDVISKSPPRTLLRVSLRFSLARSPLSCKKQEVALSTSLQIGRVIRQERTPFEILPRTFITYLRPSA